MTSPSYQIVRKMIERGNKPGIIRELLEVSLKWAEANAGQDADALKLWLKLVNLDRPFYTAMELRYFWPPLKLALGLATRLDAPPSANRLANELKFHRLPILQRDIGFPQFELHGKLVEFFIVERIAYWKRQKLTQQEFEEILK